MPFDLRVDSTNRFDRAGRNHTFRQYCSSLVPVWRLAILELMDTYTLKHSSFSHYIWINKGDPFTNPDTLNIEMVTAGKYGIEIYSVDGRLAGKAERPNAHGGWSSFYFREGWEFSPGPGLPPGTYKIKILNLSDGNCDLRGGDLDYNA